MCIYDKDGCLYVFDKINMDEGRLYKYTQGYKTVELVLEVDEGECYFGRNGLAYILYPGENSRIEVYDLNGMKLREILLSGTVYYLDIDEKGYIYALITEDENAVVNICDGDGKFIRSVHSRNMPVINCVYFSGGNIYVGGYLDGPSACIEKLNYLSFIEKSYNLDMAALKPIFSKVVFHGGYLFSLISSIYGDSLVICDEMSGDTKTYDLGSMGMPVVFDFIIKGDTIILLGAENKIAVYDLVEGELQDGFEPYFGVRKPMKQERYGYILFLIFIKNMFKDFLRLSYRFALPVSVSIAAFIYIRLNKTGRIITTSDLVLYFTGILISANLIGVAAKSVFVFLEKRYRIDSILDIYNRIDKTGRTEFINSLFTGAVISLQLFCILTINRAKNIISGGYSVAAGVFFAGLLYAAYKHYIARFINDIGCSALELLSLDYRDHDLFVKVEGEVKRLRKLGTEKYRIKIFTKDIMGSGTVRLIKNWSYLRKKITGDIGNLKRDESYIIFDLDLRNRDIKYSRISVIQDFLCYIYKNVNISSVIIETADDKNENNNMGCSV